ncbi:phytoene desaturase family protein [Corynebacterium lactis]|uniref:Phytoene dehydrogenase n=1 Tax=Corynebacterium lactis RW2-5 TaxID=1408189 RepID=A0A0K2H0U5_9CORY|nr:phytoene desaturase family protein [Corynebacterium lactis]ALA67654.1 phytoene dehydrogenase [Corynebacterium lactis RW2-5]
MIKQNRPRQATLPPSESGASRPHVVIVGAGLSGLTAGLYATAAGYRVTVVEREHFIGGRCATETVSTQLTDGPVSARFDTGATVWTMPGLVEEAVAAVGLSINDIDESFHALPVTPSYHAQFADCGGLDVFSEESAMAAELRRFGASERTVRGYSKLRVWFKGLFDASFANFMSRSFDRVTDLITGPGALSDLVKLMKLGAFGPLERKVHDFLDDSELTRVFSFQALYAGVAPAKARAVYGCISHMDTSLGVFVPRSERFGNEMGAVARILAEALTRAGGSIVLGTRVMGLRLNDEGLVSAVQVDRGVEAGDDATGALEDIAAQAVICTPDLPVVQGWMNEAGRQQKRRLIPLRFSPSAVVAHGLVPTDIAAGWPRRHHLISFGHEWDKTFREISSPSGGAIMSDPSLLVTRPAVTSPERVVQDSSGREFEPVSVLAPCPNLDSAAVDWDAVKDAYVMELASVLEERGFFGISEHWKVGRIDSPNDWLRRGMGAGSPFGLAHLFRQTGPFRPRNFSPAMPGNVILAGSTTVPGVGVPTVMISGRLAAERLGPLASH